MRTRMTQVCKQEVFGHKVPILGTVEEPLFRASDVAEWLNISKTNVSQLIKNVPEREIRKVNVVSGCASHNVLYLTEFGVYFVLMRSRKPQAEEYQYKIAEILKSIRLKGYAVSDSITEEQIAQLKKDAENKEMLLKAQSGVIRIDDRFVSSLKKLIDIYENERSKLSEINAEELFQDK